MSAVRSTSGPDAPATLEATAAELGVIETQALVVRYGTAAAVREVSLSIAERRITAIIGPSGCGKSTLLRALNRMNDFIPSVDRKSVV